MKIFDLIRNIIYKNNKLSFLEVGDVIWARRYKSDEEKDKIKIGHQQSPYVVIKKTKNKVYALLCTSTPKEYNWKMFYYPLGKYIYNMDKSTYINCIKVHKLRDSQYMYSITKLSKYDLNQLKKQLYILKNSNLKNKPNIEDKYLKYNITIGDVISYKDNLYYIHTIKGNNLYTYKTKNYSKNNKNIINHAVLINNEYHSFIFEDVIINKKEDYLLADTFNTSEIEIINNYKNTKPKNSPNLLVGMVIKYNKNIYYIYDIIKDYIEVYQIYNEYKNNMKYILVNDKKYYTYFQTSTIKIDNIISKNYKNLIVASGYEIFRNNKIFEKCNNNKKQKSNIDIFVPMTIIKHFNNNLYLILSRKDNIIEVVNINNLGDSFFYELTNDNTTFTYYRVIPKDEFDIYVKKIEELKSIVSQFK